MAISPRKCQQCGQEAIHNDRYCLNCGAVIGLQYIPEACPHCGGKLKGLPVDLKCPSCKRKVRLLCRSCKIDLPADAIFCVACGTASLELKRIQSGILTCGVCQQPGMSGKARCGNDGSLLIGQMIRGRIIKDFLGQGGMGAVYLVESANAPSPHVLKEMQPKPADPDTPEISADDLYANEVRVMSRLKGIDRTSQLLAAFEEEGIWFIAMTLLSGNTLEKLIETKQLKLPLSDREVVSILLGVGQIMEKIHAARVVLRDLKPLNIMVLSGGIALFDFGLGWDLDFKGSDFHFPNGQPAVIGTLGYAPKEQLAGLPAAVTEDIHAWGAVGYQLATGVTPFDPKKRNEAYKWPHLSAVRNYALKEVIKRSVSENPKDRYQTIGAALTALRLI